MAAATEMTAASEAEDLDKFIGIFFTLVSQMSFEKAKESFEHERDATGPGIVKSFLTQLHNFSEAEKSYCNMGFLSIRMKIFHRKENTLKNAYDSLRVELHKLEGASAMSLPIDSDVSDEKLVGMLASQLLSFIVARQQLRDLYEKMHAMSTSSKRMRYEDLTLQLKAIIDLHESSFNHPLLVPIKNSITWECDVLLSSLRAQLSLETWNMVESLGHICSANSQLNLWERTLQFKESWNLGFLKPSSGPQLIHWFNKLRAHLINKFTFYFYPMITQNTAPIDMKTFLSSKITTDLFVKFQNVQRKCFACAVLLVFDTKNSSPVEWSGPTWQHPHRVHEPSPQYLVMAAHPPKVVERMPNVVRALNERNPEVLFLDKFSFVYDTEMKCSYLLSSIEPRVTFVALFNGKKDEKDVSTMKYLSEFCTLVRGTRIFMSLKASK